MGVVAPRWASRRQLASLVPYLSADALSRGGTTSFTTPFWVIGGGTMSSQLVMKVMIFKLIIVQYGHPTPDFVVASVLLLM